MITNVKGVGYCTDPTLRATYDRRMVPSYQKWVSMLGRVHDESYLQRFPTYRDVTISAEWYDYSNFKSWYDSQYKEDNWELDKDILFPTLRVYSPETCCLVPKEINYLLVGNTKYVHEDLPRGVTWHKRVGKYYMQCGVGTGKYVKKYFNNLLDAVSEYRRVKASAIRMRVDEFRGRIRPDVAAALEVVAQEVENGK